MEKNLFDAKRGSRGSGKEEPVFEDAERIEEAVLLGTVVAGAERFAIVNVPSHAVMGAGRGNGKAGRALRRLALGDTVWGFRLSEIGAEKVVFKKGPFEVELVLDFSRKVVSVQERPKAKPSPKTRRQKKVRKKRR